MLSLCKNDKDRFIKLLDILDYTYFGNVLSLNKFQELFKQKNEASEAASKAKSDLLEASAAPEDSSKMIDTTAVKPQAEEGKTKVDEAIVLSTDTQVPIRMIKSLIKLLNKDSTVVEVERSAFEDEQDSQSNTQTSYTTKQLQELWKITLESLKLKTIEVEQLISDGVLEDMI